VLTITGFLIGFISVFASLVFFFYTTRRNYLKTRTRPLERESNNLMLEILRRERGRRLEPGEEPRGDHREQLRELAEQLRALRAIDEQLKKQLEDTPSGTVTFAKYIAPALAILGTIAGLLFTLFSDYFFGN
jgi:hypothetical protein